MPTRKKQDDRIAFAFLATFLSIIGFVIALIMKRDDDYVMFYAKQSLIVFIVGAVLGVLGRIFLVLPVIGDLIYFAATIITILLWVFSWVYALSGEKKEVAFVGKYSRKLDL